MMIVELALLTALTAAPMHAQQVYTQPVRTITVQRGHAAMLSNPQPLQRVAVSDPKIAEAVVVSPEEVLINGLAAGSTSLVVWDRRGASQLYEINVTIDTQQLRDQLHSLFPEDSIVVESSGGTVLLSGAVRDTSVSRRAIELATATGAQVQGNFGPAPTRQILLKVRFGEVSRSGLNQLSTELSLPSLNGIGDATDAGIETLSDGVARLFLLGPGAQLSVALNALEQKGLFKSLAEPNLVALDGHEASFLAGGEFPFPVVQGSGNASTITIVWKEFGVRLTFRPIVTPQGTIRLKVAPEVSSLDFANGLRVQGNLIPSLVTRRAETEVELAAGQHLGIAGLIDNSIRDQAGKIPGLGDIPILGALFRTHDSREDQTELLVIVTPYFAEPTTTAPAVPGGEPATWKWKQLQTPPDTTTTGHRTP
jgi:pilus assembly protein CpaC